MKDAEDRLLDALLKPDAIADDGFSNRVVRRLRRRLWVRRLALPIAAAIGAFVAFKPIVALVPMLFGVLQNLLPSGVPALPDLPPLPLIVGGGMLLAVVMSALRLIEE